MRFSVSTMARRIGSSKLLTILCVLVTIQVFKIIADWKLIDNINLDDFTQKESQTSDIDIEYARVLTGAALDSSGHYYIHRFYKGEGFSLDMETRDVSLAVHTTADHLSELVDLATVWNGPMSITIFAPGSDAAFTDDAIDGMRLCWPVLRDTVNFHLVYPKEFPGNMSTIGSFAYLPCKDITRRLMTFKSVMQPDFKNPEYKMINSIIYPHNLVRNVAKQGALTEFVLSIDLGLIPSPHLRKSFVKFAAKNSLFNSNQTVHSNILQRSKRSVYVIPAYELRSELEPFKSKSQLISAIENKNSRPFMSETCWFCQKPTDYERWQNLPDNTNSMSINQVSTNYDLDVAYSVPYSKTWEPFFIAKRDSPYYNEKYIMYGYDRMIQTCEMHVQGYRFYVLDTPFLLFKGYRTKAKMLETERKVRENFSDFKDGFGKSLKEFGLVGDAYREC